MDERVGQRDGHGLSVTLSVTLIHKENEISKFSKKVTRCEVTIIVLHVEKSFQKNMGLIRSNKWSSERSVSEWVGGHPRSSISSIFGPIL